MGLENSIATISFEAFAGDFLTSILTIQNVPAAVISSCEELAGVLPGIAAGLTNGAKASKKLNYLKSRLDSAKLVGIVESGLALELADSAAPAFKNDKDFVETRCKVYDEFEKNLLLAQETGERALRRT